jgi:predicted CXXCH cytochrome family protein
MRTIFVGLILSVFLLAASAFGASKVEDCLGCHEGYKGFLHGPVSCNDCHSDISELPHKEKLKRPVCQDCHKGAQAAYSNSVHQRKGLDCKQCHAVHQITKEKKYCASCHANVTHKSLPAREKHLAELQCAACHSVVSESRVEIDVTLPPGTKVKKENFDRNGDGRIDVKEWTFVETYLERNFKGHYRVNKRFFVQADAHAVVSKSVSCQRCHADRNVFGKARLKQIGPVSYDLPLDVTPFVPEIPSIARYRETVHGKKGVICGDCHISREKITDGICMTCHKELFQLYKYSPHGTKSAANCTDCHNPHNIKGYRELNAQERVAVCARCHKDYIRKHLWLPNTALHFHYLECTICHSPDSQESMLFSFGIKTRGVESKLTYEQIRPMLPEENVERAIDINGDNVVSSQEFSDFFLRLRQKLGRQVYIDSAILVTKVYHNFTMTRRHEKECKACHSKDAPFYESMFLVVPSKDASVYIPINDNTLLLYGSTFFPVPARETHVYIPVKDTILSSLPLSVAVDMTLLGEQKVRLQDVRRLFSAGPHERYAFAKELGLKWIDLAGVLLVILVLCFVAVHALLRIVTRR